MSDPFEPTAPSPPGESAEPPIPELVRLGEQLACARAGAGLSEDDLARRLRIPLHQLQALEAGDHTRLPEGVFVVALARRIAGALNTDLEAPIQAVRQSRLMRRAAPPPHPPGRALSTATASKAGTGRPWRWPLLAGLVAAGVLGSAWLRVSRTGTQGGPALSARRGAPAKPPSPSAPTADAILRLSAREPSWVEVREVSGRTLFEGTLTGEKRFPIGQGIEVISGRPHAVRAAVGSGVSIPLGGVSDIRWKRFSPGEPPPPSSPSPSP
ncbi:MAG: helix-turn-helix domain-containing protein [Cyanobacteriota bacterium]